MRPMRRMGGRGGGGGFGVFGLETVAARLTLALGALSLLVELTKTGLGGVLLLMPREVFGRLFLWQPLTYGFVAPVGGAELNFLFSLLITWQSAGFLEGVWGGRRAAMLAVGVPAAAGFLTALLALAGVVTQPYYFGSWVLTSALWCANGWVIGSGRTSFWFIEVTGNTLALIGIAFVALVVITSGPVPVLPVILGIGLTFLAVRGGSPRALWMRFQHGRMQRNLRKSRKLKVVERPDRDQYLN